LLTGFTATYLRSHSLTRTCVFVLRIGAAELLLSEAIRSVSHLGLAQGRRMLLAASFRTERSRPDRSRPGSLRLGFLGQPFYYPHALVLASACVHPSGAHPESFRGQKTFSAGPRSFNTKELWFPGTLPSSGVQPVFDSRHGRIACKVYLSCTQRELQESRRLQSNHRAQIVQPLFWLTAALQNHLVFIGLAASSGNIRLGSKKGSTHR
jgi:hypothetical protein